MTQPTLQDLSKVLQQPLPGFGAPVNAPNSARASALMVLTDCITLALVLVAVLAMRAFYGDAALPIREWIPVFVAIIATNVLASAWRGIYPGYGVCASALLRSTFYTLTGVFAAIITLSLLTTGSLPFIRSIMILAWAVSVPALSVARLAIRRIISRYPWYGEPVIILGEASLAHQIVDTLRVNKHIGLRPFVIVEYDQSDAQYGYYHDIPVIAGIKNVVPLAKHFHVSRCIVALAHVNKETFVKDLETIGESVPQITLIGEQVPPSVMWISNSQTDMMMTSDVALRLRQPALRLKKRLFDLVVAIPLLLLTAPFMALIAIAIRITSRGPAFYTQERVGDNGKTFRVLKFRTMVTNADEALGAMLEDDEAMRFEYMRYHKLKQDPRITKVGRWLRKFSMDELPQLWNVVRGEMAIVGPRPLMPSEFNLLGKSIPAAYADAYMSSRPGITGLWQVTARSTVPFSVRMSIDRYYIRNWSLFLDFYLLLRTIGVVMTGRGGY